MSIAILFALTLFASAALLFSVQPMIAKMLLPYLGGAPAVWNTCMLFFQVLLLLGYGYAHLLTRHLRLRTQVMVHLLLLAGAALALPFGISERALDSLPTQSNPVFWLLLVLGMTVGLPFFVTSTTGPLLQRWFSATRTPGSRDPYFLYSASNLGSLLALLSYPLLVEPRLRLAQQSHYWALGYGVLFLLLVGCVAVLWRPRHGQEEPLATPRATEVLPWRRRLRWMLLAFVPSSLMLGVTTYLTTDIASIPLLWVLPLALYLVTFILAFARRQPIPVRWLARGWPVAVIIITFVITSNAADPMELLVAAHLLFFFYAAWLCHGLLAADRPEPEQLTEFYLWLSAGGALGGLFNGLVAPLLFRTVLEYPLAIVVACLVQPGWSVGLRLRFLDAAWALGLGVLTAGLAWVVMRQGIPLGLVSNALVLALPTILAFLLAHRPLRFALAIGALLAAGSWYVELPGHTLEVRRSFFGVSKVDIDPTGRFHQLMHGNTTHGRQFIDPARSAEPLTYYHRNGPLGHIFKAYNAAPASPRVGVIGLGSGSMAAYAQPGQDWTFYEIDPVVISLARDPRYFSFLSGIAPAMQPRIIPGDARLRLREAEKQTYGLLVLDAFSSDSIPTHLLTRQALALYLEKLAPGGFLAMHISNRYLDLEPVLKILADDAGLVAAHHFDNEMVPEDGKERSHWVIMARRKADFGLINRSSQWITLDARPGVQLWTDDFSNILSVFKREEE